MRRSPTACPYRLSAHTPPPPPLSPSYDGRVEWGQERRGQVQNDARWTAHAIEEARRRRIAVWRHTVSATCGASIAPAIESLCRERPWRATRASLSGVPCVCALPRVQIRRLEAHAVQVGMHFGCERSLDTRWPLTHTPSRPLTPER